MLEGTQKSLFELLARLNESGSTVESEIEAQEQVVVAERAKLDELLRLKRMLATPDPKDGTPRRKRKYVRRVQAAVQTPAET